MTRPLRTFVIVVMASGCVDDCLEPADPGRWYECGTPVHSIACIDAVDVNNEPCLADAVCADACIKNHPNNPEFCDDPEQNIAHEYIEAGSCEPVVDWLEQLESEIPQVPNAYTWGCLGTIEWTGTDIWGDPVEGSIGPYWLDCIPEGESIEWEDCVASCEYHVFLVQEPLSTFQQLTPCEALVGPIQSDEACEWDPVELTCEDLTSELELPCEADGSCCRQFPAGVCDAIDSGIAPSRPLGEAKTYEGQLVVDGVTIPMSAELVSLVEPGCDPALGCPVYIEDFVATSTDGFTLQEGRTSFPFGEVTIDLAAPVMAARSATLLAVPAHTLLVDVDWELVASGRGERQWRVGQPLTLTTTPSGDVLAGTLVVGDQTVSLSLTATP